MAIQSDETLVTKGNLKELYQDKILPYLGGNMMMTTNVSDYYSTDEKVVGIWTDGKPIYQKTFNGTYGSPSSSDQRKIYDATVNITDGETFIDGWGWVDYKWNDTWTRFSGVFTNGSMTVQSATAIQTKQTANTITFRYFTSMSLQENPKYCYTVQYTKTTDTASSALTTPGCYDLNRPDLWPVNQEIFFGNGLYGKRYTGTISPTTSLVAYTIDASWKNKSYIVKNASGWIGRGCMLNASNTSLAYMLYLNTSQGLCIQAKDGASVTSTTYDIWVTYTK